MCRANLTQGQSAKHRLVSGLMRITMSLSGVSGTSLASIYAQQRQDFQTLASAVSSGDLSQAQQALSAFQANKQASQTTTASSEQTLQGSSGLGVQIKTDFSALSSAVQSGDLTGAKKALASLQQDFSSTGQSGSDGSQTSQVHHHHHHGGGGESASTASSATSTTGDQTSSNPSTDDALALVNAPYADNQTSPRAEPKACLGRDP